jgi:hypothetical protein
MHGGAPDNIQPHSQKNQVKAQVKQRATIQDFAANLH